MVLLLLLAATKALSAVLISMWLRDCRYEKYDSNAVVREKTDDPFQDELNMVADKVQDLQLVGQRLAGLAPAAWLFAWSWLGKQMYSRAMWLCGQVPTNSMPMVLLLLHWVPAATGVCIAHPIPIHAASLGLLVPLLCLGALLQAGLPCACSIIQTSTRLLCSGRTRLRRRRTARSRRR